MNPRSNFKHCGGFRGASRRGLMLVIVLVMVVLLSLLAAGYTLMVNAHLKGVTTQLREFKIRQAAESGVQSAIVTLRYTRGDVDSWYNNPARYRAFLVQGKEGEEAKAQFQERVDSDQRTFDPTADQAFRVSLIAPNFDDPSDVRYGFTDESARLDLNSATPGQLKKLFGMTIPENAENPLDINALVDAVVDWRDQDDSPSPNGAESEYYKTLKPPYGAKNAPFSTVEELLLVRGFNGWILFGEDYNRNGLLDPNEDDGSESFPPDDANGVLFRGIEPFLTVWSQEANISGDNRPRIFLNQQDTQKLQEKLETEIGGELASYIMNVRNSGITFNSVMNLLPAPPPDEEEPASQPEEQAPTTTQPTGGDPTSQPSGENSEGGEDGLADQDGSVPGSENQGPGGGTGQPTSGPAPTSQPALPVYQDLTSEPPPGTVEDLPLILDRLTVSPSPILSGRINVSTAPREVLSMIEELTPEEVDAIVTARRELDSATKSSPSWLVSQGVISEYKFRRILDKITTKSSVYRVEAVGFADDIGVVERFMVILQMRGPVAQVIYYRNLDSLGMAYTPHGDEKRTAQDRSK